MLNGEHFLRRPIKILNYKECSQITVHCIMQIDGLSYVRVLPPQSFFQFIPVLPFRPSSKLMFFKHGYKLLNTYACWQYEVESGKVKKRENDLIPYADIVAMRT